MYRTACNKQNDQLQDKPQQAAQNQPKEAQNISQTLKLYPMNAPDPFNSASYERTMWVRCGHLNAPHSQA